MSRLILVVAAVAFLAGCGPTCDSSDPHCMLWTPPAEVQHRYFVECMQLAPPSTASKQNIVEACEDYAFRIASKEGRPATVSSVPITVKSYQ